MVKEAYTAIITMNNASISKLIPLSRIQLVAYKSKMKCIKIVYIFKENDDIALDTDFPVCV